MDDESEDTIAKSYEQAYNSYGYKTITKYEYVLENYLVNNIFSSVFSLHSEKHTFKLFLDIFVKHIIIKMFIVSYANTYKEEFDENKLIEIIVKFQKHMGHNPEYFNLVKEFILDNELDSIGYILILLKE